MDDVQWKTVVDDHANSVPERITESAAPKPQEEKPAAPQFDPKIHRTKDGKPVVTKSGSFALKPGAGAPKKSIVGQTPPGAPAGPGAPAIGALETAKYTSELFFGLNIQFFGEKARPNPETKSSIQYAGAAYMESKGIQNDIPPGVMLLLVLSGYYAQVLQHEEPQSKLKKTASWLKAKFSRKRGGIVDGTRDDSGANRVGKDNIGENS